MADHGNQKSQERFVILGAGQFGRLALERLSKRHPAARFWVVDNDGGHLKDCLRSVNAIERINATAIRGDAVTVLERDAFGPGTWIIPTVPLHVTFKWLLWRLNGMGSAVPLPVPGEVDTLVPNPLRMGKGTVYASFADFKCPDQCSEAGDICTATGEQRRGELYQLIGGLDIAGYRTDVVRSLQLAPGVGGFRMARLEQCLDSVAAKPGRYIIATSCRCHGVIDALEWSGSGAGVDMK